ncbi:thioesterase domain-containing protein, partial [Verrucomicrobiales bacterium]|nr:thioesterase domain-containing protein [Verrucomicrobiales bacterium]
GDGGILFYRELVRWLPKETPLYAIEAPMLMDSSKISDQSNIREIADEYLAKVETVRPDGPYSLCGYSFGGVVSYEMAQRLYSRNIEVEKLILFDTPNPAQELENKYSLSQRAQVNWEFLGEEKVGKRIGTIAKRASKGVVSKLKHRREVKHAMTCLENGTPVSGDVRLIQIREVHTRMIERYVPIPYAGKMTLLRATGPNDYCYYSPQLGWEGLVEGGIQVVETPGTHLEIFDEPYVGSLGERMKEILIS